MIFWKSCMLLEAQARGQRATSKHGQDQANDISPPILAPWKMLVSTCVVFDGKESKQIRSSAPTVNTANFTRSTPNIKGRLAPSSFKCSCFLGTTHLINHVIVDQYKLEVVVSFCYPGDPISVAGGCEAATMTQVRLAWVKFCELLPISGP